jgi:hypothetical protein
MVNQEPRTALIYEVCQLFNDHYKTDAIEIVIALTANLLKSVRLRQIDEKHIESVAIDMSNILKDETLDKIVDTSEYQKHVEEIPPELNHIHLISKEKVRSDSNNVCNINHVSIPLQIPSSSSQINFVDKVVELIRTYELSKYFGIDDSTFLEHVNEFIRRNHSKMPIIRTSDNTLYWASSFVANILKRRKVEYVGKNGYTKFEANTFTKYKSCERIIHEDAAYAPHRCCYFVRVDRSLELIKSKLQHNYQFQENNENIKMSPSFVNTFANTDESRTIQPYPKDEEIACNSLCQLSEQVLIKENVNCKMFSLKRPRYSQVIFSAVEMIDK